MTDKSLLKDLESFQELSDQEVSTVTGGISLQNFQLGGCPACLSGIPPLVLKPDYLEVVSKPSINLGLQQTLSL